MPLDRTLVPRRFALHPILFAAYAVLFLYASNLGEADLGQLLPVLVLVVAGAALVYLVGALVLRDAARMAILLTAGLLIVFGYGHAIELSSGTPLAGRPMQLIWLAVAVAAVVLAVVGGRPLRTATRGLDVVGFALVLVAVVTIVPYELGRVETAASPSAPVSAPSGSAPEGPRRDIWFLVFDRYGSEESLRLRFGITDNDLPGWLAAQGFHVVPAARANYVKTTLSLSSTLNLDYLDELGSQSSLLDDHAVGRYLTGLGYRYVHVDSGFGPTRTSSLATVVYGGNQLSDFALALYDSSIVPIIARRLSPDDMIPGRRRRYEWVKSELDATARARTEPGPKFLFAHFLIPHPPYVFNEDGSAVSDTLRASRSLRQAFAIQLRYTNERIRELIEPLLAVPEAERPIIIIAADEGPYPERYARHPDGGQADYSFDWSKATSEEVRIKFGILLALYLPGLDDPGVSPTMSSVNTFRLVLSRYFGANLPLLPNRSLAPRGAGGPGVVDITDRLPAAP